MNKATWLVMAFLGTVVVLAILAGMFFVGGWNNGGWGMMGSWGPGIMHGWGMIPFGWFGMILVWLIPIAFIVLVVLGISGLIRGFNSGQKIAGPHPSPEDRPSAREILQIRYAHGEITREQYLEMLDDLA